MASNTSYDPKNMLDFEKSKLNKDAKGLKASASLGTTTTIDYTLTDDLLLSGGSVVLVKNAKWGDKVTFQVIYGGSVINQFITDWYMNPEKIEQSIPSSNYPAKILTGMVLRVVYTSVGGSIFGDVAPEVIVNYNFEKVLV